MKYSFLCCIKLVQFSSFCLQTRPTKYRKVYVKYLLIVLLLSLAGCDLDDTFSSVSSNLDISSNVVVSAFYKEDTSLFVRGTTCLEPNTDTLTTQRVQQFSLVIDRDNKPFTLLKTWLPLSPSSRTENCAENYEPYDFIFEIESSIYTLHPDKKFFILTEENNVININPVETDALVFPNLIQDYIENKPEELLIVDKDTNLSGNTFQGQVAFVKSGTPTKPITLDCGGGVIDSSVLTTDHMGSSQSIGIYQSSTLQRCNEFVARTLEQTELSYLFNDKITGERSLIANFKNEPTLVFVSPKIKNIQIKNCTIKSSVFGSYFERITYIVNASGECVKSSLAEDQLPNIVRLIEESDQESYFSENIQFDNVHFIGQRGVSDSGIFVGPYQKNYTIFKSTVEKHNRGIYLDLGSSKTVISQSNIHDNFADGIAVDASIHNQILDNFITENGYAGISLYKNCGETRKGHWTNGEVPLGVHRYIGANHNLIMGNTIANQGTSNMARRLQTLVLNEENEIQSMPLEGYGIILASRQGYLPEEQEFLIRSSNPSYNRELDCTGNGFETNNARLVNYQRNGVEISGYAWFDYAQANQIINNTFMNNPTNHIRLLDGHNLVFNNSFERYPNLDQFEQVQRSIYNLPDDFISLFSNESRPSDVVTTNAIGQKLSENSARKIDLETNIIDQNSFFDPSDGYEN